MTPGKIHVILNASAGAGQRDAGAAVLEAFSAHALTPQITTADPARDDIGAIARQAALEADGAVVAAGGDGTISSVAMALAGGRTPLGVIPMGTLNHFARDLGIPTALADAVRTIVEGHVETVDVGEVNGRTFINNSSIGIYPQLVQYRGAYQKQGYRKSIALLRASLDVIRRYSFVKYGSRRTGGA